MDDADADPLQIIEPFAALPFVLNWGCVFKKTQNKTKKVLYQNSWRLYFEQLGGPADVERKCGERCSLVERQEVSQEQLSAASLRWLHVWSLQQMGEQLSPGLGQHTQAVQIHPGPVSSVWSGSELFSQEEGRDAAHWKRNERSISLVGWLETVKISCIEEN